MIDVQNYLKSSFGFLYNKTNVFRKQNHKPIVVIKDFETINFNENLKTD